METLLNLMLSVLSGGLAFTLAAGYLLIIGSPVIVLLASPLFLLVRHRLKAVDDSPSLSAPEFRRTRHDRSASGWA
ncbi:MAG: hypothetical protein KDD43_06815 [Bdellovibrionales bacterium]|nr:hypothetical protein [Bdellovibrionales bacterium]